MWSQGHLLGTDPASPMPGQVGNSPRISLEEAARALMSLGELCYLGFTSDNPVAGEIQELWQSWRTEGGPSPVPTPCLSNGWAEVLPGTIVHQRHRSPSPKGYTIHTLSGGFITGEGWPPSSLCV